LSDPNFLKRKRSIFEIIFFIFFRIFWLGR